MRNELAACVLSVYCTFKTITFLTLIDGSAVRKYESVKESARPNTGVRQNCSSKVQQDLDRGACVCVCSLCVCVCERERERVRE